MNRKMKCFFSALTLVALLLLTLPAIGNEGIINQDDFASLLFDRLDLADNATSQTKEQKIQSLEELNFAPINGYAANTPLSMKQLVQILVRVHSLDAELQNSNSYDSAMDLLIRKGILEEKDRGVDFVERTMADSVVSDITPSLGTKSGFLVVPHVPIAPPASPIE